MMNVFHFIWQALYYRKMAWQEGKFQNLWRHNVKQRITINIYLRLLRYERNRRGTNIDPWRITCSKLQSFSYFETLCCYKFSLHHKWNEAQLLVLNMYIQIASRGADRLETLDLRKLGKVRKISKVPRVTS